MSKRRSKGLHELADDIAKLIDEPGSQLAHVTPGELVIPSALLTPKFLAVIEAEARKQGIDPARLFVGSGRNSINPRTGQAEFFDPAEEPVEGITVTAPQEQGLVQLPQDIPNEFRTYGKPGGGVNQYGLPATMGVIGEASHRWTADGRSPFYVGDISNSAGLPYEPHASWRSFKGHRVRHTSHPHRRKEFAHQKIR